MARRPARAKKEKPISQIEVRVPLDVSIPDELRGLGIEGSRYSIPSTIPAESRLDYILSNAREELLKAEAAEAEAMAQEEKEAREKALLEQRVQQARAEAEAASEANEEPMESAPQPNGIDALHLAASLNNVMGSLLAQSKEVQAQQQQVTDLVAMVEVLQQKVAAAGVEKSQAMDLIKNSQTMMSGLVESTGLQIQAMQSSINAAATEAEAYRQAMTDNLEAVEAARNITESAVGIARDVALEEAARQKEQNIAYLDFILRVVGIDRSQALQQLNALRVEGKPVMTGGEYDMMLSIYRQANESMAQTEDTLNAAASEMNAQRAKAQSNDPNF